MHKPIGMALLLSSLICLTGCHFSFTDGYMFDYSGIELEQQSRGEFPEGIKNVTVENRFGNVVVSNHTEGQVGWEWTGKVWSGDEELGELFLDELQLAESIDNGEFSLILTMPEPDKELNGVKSHLTIYLPEGVAFNSTNSHGNTQVSGVRETISTKNRHGNTQLLNTGPKVNAVNTHGNVSAHNVYDVDIENSHGNVTMANAMGAATIKTSHGKVSATNVNKLEVNSTHSNINVQNGIGDMNLNTSHGRITVESVRGNLSLDNRHGNIVVKDLRGQILAETSHANISVSGQANVADLNNRHGNITLDLNNSEFKMINLDSSHGNLTVNLPAQSVIDLRMDGKGSSDFASDSNGSPVRLDTSHGRIQVNAKGK